MFNIVHGFKNNETLQEFCGTVELIILKELKIVFSIYKKQSFIKKIP